MIIDALQLAVRANIAAGIGIALVMLLRAPVRSTLGASAAYRLWFIPAIMALDLWGLGPTDKAIWFGILMLMVVEIGLIHPPVGLNVYVINSLARDVPMMETFKGVIPFLISDFLRVALLFLFPAISLCLVRLVS